MNLGEHLLACAERRPEALAAYDKAVTELPNDAGAHFNRGNLLRDLGRLDEAIALARAS